MRCFKQISLIIAISMSAACEKPPPPQKEIIRPVRVLKVLGTGGGRKRTFPGTARAGVTSSLSFKVAGTLAELPIKVGDRVEKGQLLAKLDQADLRLQLQEGRAALSQALAQQRNAKVSYERVRALYETKNVSRAELDAARLASESGDAQVRSLQQRVALARRQLDYCLLRAPADGSIAQVNVDLNENVAPGAPVVVLTSGNRAEVLVQVPEILITKVEAGAKVSVRFDALPGKQLDGEIVEVGVAPSAAATTFPVTVRLSEDVPEVRPGMAAEVEMSFARSDGKERFIVPPVAVGSDGAGPFVFVVKPESDGFGTVHRREVKTGELTSDGLEIFEGLEDGDLLVTAGVSRIKDQQKVRLLKGQG